MTKRCISILVLLLGMVAAAIAQQPNDSPNTLGFENGTIVSGRYSNECLGFSLPIPAGWNVIKGGEDGKAKHLTSGKDLALLLLRKPPRDLVFVNAWDATGQNQDKSAQEFVSNAVREKINSQTERRDLTRDAFAVDYDGRHFFRSDYKSLLQNGMSEYWSYIFTKFRGYFIGETIDSSSQEGLDDAANSLQGISFQEDQVNSTCVMSPVDVGSASKPRSGFPMRVRVSSGVSAGLLSKKVQPQYPEEAKKEGVQGRVVLQAEIDENGNVQHLMLISGHPTLAPAAIAAVNQWKYKPYLLNDQPVAVETQVIVDFELKRR